MQPDSGAPGSSSVPGTHVLAIVSALASERRAFVRGAGTGDGLCPIRSGPGPGAARAAASRALRGGADGLVSFGLAGGLVAAATSGTVVLPSRLVDAVHGAVPVDSGWRSRLCAALGDEFAVLDGAIAAVDSPVTTPDDKARLAAVTGAVAVDTESYAIAAVAREANVPFVAIRIVVDAYDDALPNTVASFVSPRGFVLAHRALVAALRSHRDRRLIHALGRRSAVAHAVLTRVAARLSMSGFAVARTGGAAA